MDRNGDKSHGKSYLTRPKFDLIVADQTDSIGFSIFDIPNSARREPPSTKATLYMLPNCRLQFSNICIINFEYTQHLLETVNVNNYDISYQF